VAAEAVLLLGAARAAPLLVAVNSEADTLAQVVAVRPAAMAVTAVTPGQTARAKAATGTERTTAVVVVARAGRRCGSVRPRTEIKALAQDPD
jgi:hypothetical protein